MCTIILYLSKHIYWVRWSNSIVWQAWIRKLLDISNFFLSIHQTTGKICSEVGASPLSSSCSSWSVYCNLPSKKLTWMLVTLYRQLQCTSLYTKWNMMHNRLEKSSSLVRPSLTLSRRAANPFSISYNVISLTCLKITCTTLFIKVFHTTEKLLIATMNMWVADNLSPFDMLFLYIYCT